MCVDVIPYEREERRRNTFFSASRFKVNTIVCICIFVHTIMRCGERSQYPFKNPSALLNHASRQLKERENHRLHCSDQTIRYIAFDGWKSENWKKKIKIQKKRRKFPPKTKENKKHHYCCYPQCLTPPLSSHRSIGCERFGWLFIDGPKTQYDKRKRERESCFCPA